MECLIGIQGKDFVLVAADKVSARSIVSMKQGTRKLSVYTTLLLGDTYFRTNFYFDKLRGVVNLMCKTFRLNLNGLLVIRQIDKTHQGCARREISSGTISSTPFRGRLPN